MEADLVVVGGGISGLAAVDAALSSEKRAPERVILVNDGERIGGHAMVSSLASGERVDLGFMVYNDWTYPNMLDLYAKYCVESIETDMSFAVDTSGSECWSFQSSAAWLARYAWRPSTWQFVSEYSRFRLAALDLLRSPNGSDVTLGSFWEHLPPTFVRGWLKPFVRAVWSVEQDGDVADFPAMATMTFMNNHGFLDDFSQMLAWRTPKHRSSSLCDAIVKRWTEEGRLLVVSAPATACSTTHVDLADGRTIRASRGIILATHAPTQRKLLLEHVGERATVLREARSSRWIATLHRDTTCMPKHKYDWSSWNVLPDGRLTYWLSRLQNLEDDTVFLTLAPSKSSRLSSRLEEAGQEEEQPNTRPVEHVINRVAFDHPVLTPATTTAARELRRMARGTSLAHAGAWLAHGFHEDGILSGRRAARDILGDTTIPVARPDARTPLPPRRVVAHLSHVDSDNVAFASKSRMLRFEAGHAPPRLVVQADHPGLSSRDASLSSSSSSMRDPLRNAHIREAFCRETGAYPDGRVEVITTPRPASFIAAFNPLTWCLIYDDFDNSRVVGHMVEVHNTPYGEATVYGWLGDSHVAAKKLHVSPGHDHSQKNVFYEFSVVNDNELSVRLVTDAGGEEKDKKPFFSTVMRVVPDPEVATTLRHQFSAPLAFLEVYARMFYRVVWTRRRTFFSYTPTTTTTTNGDDAADSSPTTTETTTARVTIATLVAVAVLSALSPSSSMASLVAVALWACAVWSTCGCEWRLDRLMLAEILFLTAATMSPSTWRSVAVHVLAGTLPLSRSTRVGFDALALVVASNRDELFLAKWTMVWLCARIVFVGWQEHCAGRADACRVGYRHDIDVEAQRRGMTRLCLLHAVVMAVFSIAHFPKIFAISATVPFNDVSVAVCNNAFRGFMAHDLVLGLLLEPRHRKSLQYTPLIFFHHALFWLASSVNSIYEIYSHDFVYLVAGELSTVLLYLNIIFPSNIAIFLSFVATFGATRVVLLAVGFAFFFVRFPSYLDSASHDVPAWAVWLTPTTIVLAVFANAYWFKSLWKKCWQRVLPRYACRLAQDFLGRRGLAGMVQIGRQARAVGLVLRRGDVGLGEGYVEEAWTTRTTDDLASVLGAAARAYGVLTDTKSLLGLLCTRAVKATFSFDTATGRKASISAHYDQNADLFRHMLGKTMVYTSAFYASSAEECDDGLDDAQTRKIKRILELGFAKPGKRLLDLGCGYGELVREATDAGLEAVGLTNSIQMREGAEVRLDPRQKNSAKFVLGDMLVPPPNLGLYDVVTCVEAIEALRHDQYRPFARTVSEHLAPRGRVVFQIIHGYGSRNPTIRVKESRPPSTFVQTYIFPDQQLPYLEHVYDEFRAAGLKCVFAESTGADYAKTLRAWRHNVDGIPSTANVSRPTRRIFEFYLAWCEAGFDSGLIDVSRCVFEKVEY